MFSFLLVLFSLHMHFFHFLIIVFMKNETEAAVEGSNTSELLIEDPWEGDTTLPEEEVQQIASHATQV